MNSNEILNKYIDLIDKGYCSDCNELNCIDNFPHSKITHAIRELQQENKILRENAENNDKVVDKVNWENMLLKKENQELKSQLKGTTHCFDEEEHEKLKKQLEEYKDKINWYENFEVNKTIDKLRLKHNAQQKEFISYLENEIKSSLALDTINKQTAMHIYSTTLRKYKSIIGDDK